MTEVERAMDGMDRTQRSRRATGEEYEGLRKIMAAELAEPKGVGQAGRRKLITAIGSAQMAAASMREGWKKGTEGQWERDEGVGEMRETLNMIIRAWAGSTQRRPGWKDWHTCKCDNKLCTCKHVVVRQDMPFEWAWMIAWRRASGGKRGEKRTRGAWRKGPETGGEKLEWNSVIRRNGEWEATMWNRPGETDIGRRMDDRSWRGRRNIIQDTHGGETKREGETAGGGENTGDERGVGGKAAGRHRWRRGEFARYCRDTQVGMWEGIWRRVGEERGNGYYQRDRGEG